MLIKKVIFVSLLLAIWVGPAPAGVFQWGRDLKDQNTVELDLTAGKVVKIQGSVEETIRPYYEQIGQDTPGESYTLSELGLDGKKVTFGIYFEKRWKYLTLGVNGFITTRIVTPPPSAIIISAYPMRSSTRGRSTNT